jgi:formamidopyrimidine-DNA glycosylase
MPEYPDIVVYVERLNALLKGRALRDVRVASPFVLRSVEPPVAALAGCRLQEVRRMGKRVVFGFERELSLVLHLMVLGRLHWRSPERKVPRRNLLAALTFDNGIVTLTESGTRKRASMHVVRGRLAMAEFDPGGVEVMGASVALFGDVLRRESHTLKRALTDPHLFSGIGNAYSDEILHRARLSPVKLTGKLDNAEVQRLYHATRQVLREFTERIRAEAGDGLPEKVTAFRPEMAVHGRYAKPCPVCGTAVQRIRYAEDETNYCPTCQTGGRLLADRALSRLLRKDWPRSLEQLEARRESHAGRATEGDKATHGGRKR